MQAGRPYPDRLFYSGQFNRAIAPSLSANHATQFSQVKPGMRENSLTLLVTKVMPRSSAWDAISKSIAPITIPIFYNSARILP